MRVRATAARAILPSQPCAGDEGNHRDCSLTSEPDSVRLKLLSRGSMQFASRRCAFLCPCHSWKINSRALSIGLRAALEEKGGARGVQLANCQRPVLSEFTRSTSSHCF